MDPVVRFLAFFLKAVRTTPKTENATFATFANDVHFKDLCLRLYIELVTNGEKYNNPMLSSLKDRLYFNLTQDANYEELRQLFVSLNVFQDAE